MSYLKKVHEQTDTRFWVNNPTLEDTRVAIANDAFGCTTNPAYCSKLMQTDPDWMRGVIRDVVADNPGKGGSRLAETAYHEVARQLMEQFLPIYEESNGTRGFVTIQEDPRNEENHEFIIEACLRAAKLAPNYMAKIPVTAHGLPVIAAMLRHNIPVCATEVFTLSQARATVELYEKIAGETGNRPAMYVTHITGIMDDYFKDVVKKEKIDIRPEALAAAGTAVALKQYAYLKDKDFNGAMLGGGARNLGHFTDFVGGAMHVTINWSTGAELIDAFEEPERKIDRVIPADIIAELIEKLPNFERAYTDNAMTIDEFADFGPVMLFRTQFLNGYVRLVDEIDIMRRQ